MGTTSVRKSEQMRLIKGLCGPTESRGKSNELRLSGYSLLVKMWVLRGPQKKQFRPFSPSSCQVSGKYEAECSQISYWKSLLSVVVFSSLRSIHGKVGSHFRDPYRSHSLSVLLHGITSSFWKPHSSRDYDSKLPGPFEVPSHLRAATWQKWKSGTLHPF